MNIRAQKTVCYLNTDLCGRPSMQSIEPFMNAKHKSSTETVMSAVMLPIRYLTETARIFKKHMVSFS